MSFSFSRPLIHGTIVGGESVRVCDVQLVHWPLAPAGPDEVRAHLVFWFSWDFGTRRRGPFVVGIGEARLRENHYSLIAEGEDPAVARVGLLSWKPDQSEPDTEAAVIWAELFLEEGIDALREFALGMGPGDEVAFWLPEDERWSDTRSAIGFFGVFSKALSEARTDGVWYAILASYSGRRAYVMCFSRSGAHST